MNLNTYLITIDPKVFDSGIDKIAIVESPAIEEYSIRLADHLENVKSLQVLTFDSEKQIIAGPVLIPDKQIYRKEGKHEFFVVFDKQIIERMAEKFAKENRSIKFNLNHNNALPVEGFIKGSWIIQDKENDKSKFYGFNDLPVGTFFIEAKIEDKEVWDNVIKKMSKVGFSIEGLLGLTNYNQIINQNFGQQSEYINQNKQTHVKKLNFLAKKTQAKKKFNIELKQFEEVMTSDNMILMIPELVEGATVETLDAENNVVKAEDGTYVIPEAGIEIVVKDGVVATINKVEETPAEMAEDKPEDKVEDKPVEEPVKMEMDPEVLNKFVELENRISALEARFAEQEMKSNKFSNQKEIVKHERIGKLIDILNKK